jgi:signal transduction histidine kinase/ActR/RegA family two-component response regulator
VRENLRLRTKLLLSFFLLTTSLTCTVLLVVRHNFRAQAQLQIERDARSAISTFQFTQRQQTKVLSHKAELLASLALLRDGDVTTIDDASNDPWQSEDCNLLLLADKRGRILAMHFSGFTISPADAQLMLTSSVNRGENAGWWFGNGNLYQVVLQAFYEDSINKKNLGGYVVVGKLMDYRAVGDLGKITTSDVVLRYGDEIVASTLPTLQGAELSRQTREPLQSARLHLEGQDYYASSIELTPNVSPSANLLILESYSQVAAYLEKLNRSLLALGLIAILAGSALIFVISETMTRPLVSLGEGVQALERGDFTYPLETSGNDELSKLTRSFSGMRSTLQTNQEQREQLESQLRQALKMEALGRLAGGVAHDFNNLLTVIAGHGDLLMDRVKPDNALFNSCQQIRKTADRAATLTRQLLAFSRKQVLQPKVLALNDLIVDVSKLLRRLIREDIELNLHFGDSLGHVKLDPGQIEQVLLNLAVNASDAMPLGGRLTIETQKVVVDMKHADVCPEVPPGEYVLLSVSDTGQGMDATTKSRIFEPFFTTKELGKGTGLGLATVYGVVKQSGGFIVVDSEPGKGTKFELYLPVTFELDKGSSNREAKQTASLNRCRHTVLVVEDEKDVRDLATEFLTSAGYSVLTAQDGLEALETLERLGSSVQLVLTDVVMPRMRGTELGTRLRNRMPNLKIVYMTGYFEQVKNDSESLGSEFLLQKPFSRESMLRLLRDALQSKHAPILTPD